MSENRRESSDVVSPFFDHPDLLFLSLVYADADFDANIIKRTLERH